MNIQIPPECSVGFKKEYSLSHLDVIDGDWRTDSKKIPVFFTMRGSLKEYLRA